MFVFNSSDIFSPAEWAAVCDSDSWAKKKP